MKKICYQKISHHKNGHNSAPRATQKLRICMQVATDVCQLFARLPGGEKVKKALIFEDFWIFPGCMKIRPAAIYYIEWPQSK